MSRVLKKSWHEAFFDCVSPHTDTPDAYIYWSAISLIGAVLKNNTFFKIGTYVLYPNLYVILTGPPGVGKGTAMNIIEQLVEDTGQNKIVNILADRNTAESILIDIADGWGLPLSLANQQIVVGAKEHSCLCFCQEIRVLLGASDWMLEFLEVAWSQTKFTSKTKNKGKVEISDMCFSLLAASVPEFLRNGKQDTRMVITGGFSSRCLFIVADKPSKNLPWPEPLKDNARSKDLWNKLIVDLLEISKLRGSFKVATDARLALETFLTQNLAAMKSENSEAVINARARIKANTLKIAMVLSASRSDSLVIEKLDVTNAISEMTRIIGSLDKLFRGIGDSVDAENIARVQDLIEKYGMLSKSEILRSLRYHLTSEALDRILMVLLYTGLVESYDQSKITYYKQAKKPGGQKVP